MAAANNNETAAQSRRSHHFDRFRQITMVLVKYRLGELIRTLGLDRFLPFHLVPPGNPFIRDGYSRSQRTRMALEELGTTFIKVGQILSTRTDILASDYTLELSKLQNSLTPLPPDVVEGVIKDELGRPPSELFTFFDHNPLGVASIGQAHAATLANGMEVVIKVQKPGVVEQVAGDLEILRELAAISVKQGQSNLEQYNVASLVEELGDTLNGELDYIREGHSAEHFARFFEGDTTIHIPKILWEYTTSRVITLERIRGIGILDIKKLTEAGFDRKQLAKRAVEIWVKMVFNDTIFHADPHPGNLFVEHDGRLGLVDFGMIGVLDNEVKDYLVYAVKGILDRDVNLLVDSLIDLGAIATAGSKESLRKDLKHIMSHFPLGAEDLRLTSNFGDIFGAVRRNHIQLPANTFLLLKAMSMAQSLGLGLDPDFDFFALLKPYVERILEEKGRPSKVLRRVPPAMLELAYFGLGLPARINRIARAIERGELQINTDVSGLERHVEHLEGIINRVLIALIIAALIIGGAVVYLAYKIQ